MMRMLNADAESEEWVAKRLGGYTKMQVPERKKAVAELTKEGLSTRQIGEVLGVSQPTVTRDRDSNESLEAVEAAQATEWGRGSDSDESPPDLAAEAKTKTRKQRDLKAQAKREDRETREALVGLRPLGEIVEAGQLVEGAPGGG